MELIQALSVVLTAMVKFLFAGLLSFSLGFDLWITMGLTALGGCIGVIVFYFSGSWLVEWFRQRYVRRRDRFLAEGRMPVRIFTRTNRWIVRVKHGYGFWGLAVVGPPILSIPVVSVLAAKYFRHDRRTLPVMLTAVLIWSVVLSVGWSFLR